MSPDAKQSTKPGRLSVPRPLATTTDLKPDDVQAIVAAVNPLIADAFALYVKTKNFHWHLAGAPVPRLPPTVR